MTDVPPPVNDCGSCEFWKQTYPDPVPDLGWRAEGEYGDTVAPWGLCDAAQNWGPKPGARFYTKDASEYRADLFTRTDFGCVEHIPRETQRG